MIFLAQVEEICDIKGNSKWYLIVAEDDLEAHKKIKDFPETREVLSLSCLAKPVESEEKTYPSIHKVEYRLMRPFVEEYSRYIRWVDRQSSVKLDKPRRRRYPRKRRRHRL